MLKKLLLVPLFASTCVFAQSTQTIPTKAYNATYIRDLSIGTVTTGAPGTLASATVTNTAGHAVVNITIPAGATGGTFVPGLMPDGANGLTVRGGAAFGAPVKFSSLNPTANSTGNNDSALFACTNSAFQGWTGGTGWTGAPNDCLHAVLNQHAPGESLGNPGVGPGGWSVQKALELNTTVNSPGISEMLSGYQTKAGIGDNVGMYLYNFSYGGATAPSDEGNHLGALQGGETNVTFTGTVTTGGTGATALVIGCTNDCGNQGDGRYLIDTHAAVATGGITATTRPSGYTPGTVTISSTGPVSSFWGSLDANVVTPAATPLGTGSTAMTFAVTKLGGAGAPVAGDLLCFAGQFHEQAKVTSVSGSGPYTITAIFATRIRRQAG